MGFSGKDYWSGLPFPLPEELPYSGIELRSPTLQADSLSSEPPGKPHRQESCALERASCLPGFGLGLGPHSGPLNPSFVGVASHPVGHKTRADHRKPYQQVLELTAQHVCGVGRKEGAV